MDNDRLAEVLPSLPFPPWTLIVLVGDVPALLLLGALAYRNHWLARACQQQGDACRKAMYQRSSRMYANFIIGSAALTVVSFGIFASALALPGSVIAGPLGWIPAIVAWFPFLVWLSPPIAVLTDLGVIRRK